MMHFNSLLKRDEMCLFTKVINYVLGSRERTREREREREATEHTDVGGETPKSELPLYM